MFPSFTVFNLEAFLTSWRKFYQEECGLELGAGILLPPVEQALGAGVIMAGNITIEQDLAAIKTRTPDQRLYRYTDQAIDGLIQKDREVPRPKQAYGGWVCPAQEATDQAPQLAKKSYLDIDGGKVIPVMIFAEYVRLFRWHLWATNGEPLDRNSWTLTGSLAAGGHVLDGNWYGDRFDVHYCGQRDSNDYIRFRQVVLPLA